MAKSAKKSTATKSTATMPKGNKGKPSSDEEYVSRVRGIEEFPDIAGILPEIAEESREIAIKIAKLDKRRKELNEEVKALLEIADYPSIGGEDWVCVRASGGGVPSISAEKLLQHGVSLKIIEKCTVFSDKYTYVQVRGKGPGGSEFTRRGGN